MTTTGCQEDGGGFDGLRKRTAQHCVPFSVSFELTYRCNLKCRHCYVRAAEGREELSTGECLTILRQLGDAGFFFLIFTGGEPMTRPDFFELAEEARKLTFALKLMTNGTLIDEAAADRIAGLDFVSVDMSVYGRPAVHDHITGVDGSQADTVRAIDLLRERGIIVRVKSPIMRSNLCDFEYLRSLASDKGCQFVFDPTIVPGVGGDMGPVAERLGEDDLEDLFTRSCDKSPIEPGGNHVDGEPVCNAGRNTARITPYGDLTACIGMTESVGNLRDAPLFSLWGARGLAKLRRMVPEKLPECAFCELRGFCVRCPGLALTEDGSLDGPSKAACAVAAARKKLYKAGPGAAEGSS